jgi:CRISPR system Cascade subunit CasC
MLQSMPPGNLNRDNTGQPKKCIFGRVTRARISSQCLKRNIRTYFKDVFGDDLAVRTRYLPRMVADELRKIEPDIKEDDLDKIKAALAKKFEAENGAAVEDTGDGSENQDETQAATPPNGDTDRTGQLVFFPPPFAKDVAKLIATLMRDKPAAYAEWVGAQAKKLTKEEKKKLTKEEGEKLKKEVKKLNDDVENFEHDVTELSKSLTVDIGMFGRMTTSDLVVNVEAACQVAHAISTHEAIIESDYFTAMDDKKTGPGAAFMGTGETEIFFDSAVYYKYLNLDVDELKKHLSWKDDQAARAAGVLLDAAARANPTGKQNSFAAHGAHELILVELSKKKCPISYANAFLKAVEGADLMADSAKALGGYVDAVAKAFAPVDTRRLLLAVGPASVDIAGAVRVDTLHALVDQVAELVKKGEAA